MIETREIFTASSLAVLMVTAVAIAMICRFCYKLGYHEGFLQGFDTGYADARCENVLDKQREEWQ